VDSRLEMIADRTWRVDRDRRSRACGACWIVHRTSAAANQRRDARQSDRAGAPPHDAASIRPTRRGRKVPRPV